VSSLASNSSGNANTAIGLYALNANTTGNNNTALGYNSGNAITTGSNNVIIGSNTGASIATASNYIILSDGAGTERIRVISNGNVGVGTTSPIASLDVNGHIAVTSATISTAITGSGCAGPSVTGNDTRGTILFNTPPGPITNGTLISCSFSFVTTFATPPVCVVVSSGSLAPPNGLTPSVSVTTSTFSLNLNNTTGTTMSTLPTGLKFNYMCLQ
jgi:hypothetical protein